MARLGGEELYLKSDHGRALEYNLRIYERRLRTLIVRSYQHQSELQGIIKSKRKEMMQKLFKNTHMDNYIKDPKKLEEK